LIGAVFFATAARFATLFFFRATFFFVRFFFKAGEIRSTSFPVSEEQGKQYLRTSFIRGFVGASKPLSQISHFHLT
jgi:hypothetical protein